MDYIRIAISKVQAPAMARQTAIKIFVFFAILTPMNDFCIVSVKGASTARPAPLLVI